MLVTKGAEIVPDGSTCSKFGIRGEHGEYGKDGKHGDVLQFT